jgi:hypothetical protein
VTAAVISSAQGEHSTNRSRRPRVPAGRRRRNRPSRSRFGSQRRAVADQGERLRPGQDGDLAPELVLCVALENRFRSPVFLALRIRSSHLARRR